MEIDPIIIIIMGIIIVVLLIVIITYSGKVKMLERVLFEMTECNKRKGSFLIDLNKLYRQKYSPEDTDYKILLEEMEKAGVLDDNCFCLICNFKKQ